MFLFLPGLLLHLRCYFTLLILFLDSKLDQLENKLLSIVTDLIFENTEFVSVKLTRYGSTLLGSLIVLIDLKVLLNIWLSLSW